MKQKPVADPLAQEEAELRQRCYQADEAAFLKRAGEGLAKKFPQTEERWFAQHLVKTKLLPKLVDSRLRQGRKESLESLYARFLVFVGESLPPRLGTLKKTYRATNLDASQLAQLSPKEERVLDETLKPEKTYTYSVGKLARCYGEFLERSKTSPLLDLCSRDAWEVGIRWRKGLSEMVENRDSSKAAHSLGWRGTNRTALRKRFNNACVSAGLRVGS